MTEAAAGCLYLGRVMHARFKPCTHRFVYRVFSLYLDIDRVGELAAKLKLFSAGRFNLFSFHAKDHGPQPLMIFAARLAAYGVALDGGAIRLLCFPRILGYVFNPLSVYFCHGPADDLRAVLYEVRNTFGQSHSYLVRVPAGHVGGMPLAQRAAKCFHVSPFLGLAGDYRFRLREPGETLSLAIRESDAEGEILLATHVGQRADLTDRALLSAFLRHPLMTLRIVLAIHWQALKLWRKGAVFHSLPPEPTSPVTLGQDLSGVHR